MGYLATLGLRPGVRVRLTHQAPFNGPLTLRVGEVSRRRPWAAEKVRVHLLPTGAEAGTLVRVRARRHVTS